MMTQVFTGPPTITTHPTSQLTNVSMSVTLDCEGTGRGSITYRWETKRIGSKHWMNINNNNMNRYVVRNLDQSREYRCVVSSEVGDTRSNVATITVLSKLYINSVLLATCVLLVTEITTQPVNPLTAVALQDVTLSCSASINDVTYSWHRIGGSIPSKSQGQNSNELTIPKATPPDEGMYYCIAMKNGIRVESNRAMLNVDGKSLCDAMAQY